MNQPPNTINIGRGPSGGVIGGLFGNPVKEKVASEQYRAYFHKVMRNCPSEIEWLRAQLAAGKVLYCPGCGVGAVGCHARIIEQELAAHRA